MLEKRRAARAAQLKSPGRQASSPAFVGDPLDRSKKHRCGSSCPPLGRLSLDSDDEINIYLDLPEARSRRPCLNSLLNTRLGLLRIHFNRLSHGIPHCACLIVFLVNFNIFSRLYAYSFYKLDMYITLIIYTKFQIVGNGGSWVFDFLKFRKIDFSIILRHIFRKF